MQWLFDWVRSQWQRPAPTHTRVQLQQEIAAEFNDLPEELREEINRHLALRPLLQLAQASKTLRDDVDRAFVTLYKRDILTQLDLAAYEALGDDAYLQWLVATDNTTDRIPYDQPSARAFLYGIPRVVQDPERARDQKRVLARLYNDMMIALAVEWATKVYDVVSAAIYGGIDAIGSEFIFFDPDDPGFDFSITIRWDPVTRKVRRSLGHGKMATSPELRKQTRRLQEADLLTKNTIGHVYITSLVDPFVNILLGCTPRMCCALVGPPSRFEDENGLLFMSLATNGRWTRKPPSSSGAAS